MKTLEFWHDFSARLTYPLFSEKDIERYMVQFRIGPGLTAESVLFTLNKDGFCEVHGHGLDLRNSPIYAPTDAIEIARIRLRARNRS